MRAQVLRMTSSRPRTNEVDLCAAFEKLVANISRKLLAGHPLERCSNGVVTPLAPAPFHQAEGDVGEVLDPLEVADDDATGIDIEIGKNGHATGAQDLVRLEADGTVGRFDDQACLDAFRVFDMNGIFHRRRNENVARLFDAGHIAGKGLGPSKPRMLPVRI